MERWPVYWIVLVMLFQSVETAAQVRPDEGEEYAAPPAFVEVDDSSYCTFSPLSAGITRVTPRSFPHRHPIIAIFSELKSYRNLEGALYSIYDMKEINGAVSDYIPSTGQRVIYINYDFFESLFPGKELFRLALQMVIMHEIGHLINYNPEIKISDIRVNHFDELMADFQVGVFLTRMKGVTPDMIRYIMNRISPDGISSESHPVGAERVNCMIYGWLSENSRVWDIGFKRWKKKEKISLSIRIDGDKYKRYNNYIGQWRKGQHGFGFQNFSNQTYFGEWRNDRMEGFGTMLMKAATDAGPEFSFRYVGEFQKGLKNGFGQMYWPEGRVYIGEWKDDRMEGKGLLKQREGDRFVYYIGIFDDGKLVTTETKLDDDARAEAGIRKLKEWTLKLK